MKPRLIHLPFYFGLCILLIGTLFKIQHYEGAQYCVIGGLASETTFLVLVIIEVVSSKKAGKITKLVWTIVYPFTLVIAVYFVPVILLWLLIFFWGIAYLKAGRKLFLYSRTIAEKIPFDSI